MKLLEERIRLHAVPPFRLDLTAWALRRRKENIIDTWSDSAYSRVLVLENGAAAIRIRQTAFGSMPEIEALVRTDIPDCVPAAMGKIERMLGTSIALRDFYRRSVRDEALGPLVKQLRGLKPPRFASMFEALVNGIACQQLSLTVGIILLGRLAEHYGSGLPGIAQKSFPEPEKLARADIPELKTLGFSRQKAAALIELSRHMRDQPLGFDDFDAMDNEGAISRLRQYRGVGRWTAEYVLLRGLGRLDMFPGDDVGARNNLKKRFGIEGPIDYQTVKEFMSAWHPYEGFMYFHFLLEKLREQGLWR